MIFLTLLFKSLNRVFSTIVMMKTPNVNTYKDYQKFKKKSSYRIVSLKY